MEKKERPYRKWTDKEVKAIIKFLHENNQDFELPTRQVFYRKLVEETAIDVPWNLVRWKVRNLRVGFTKALESMEMQFESEELASSVRDKVLKLCPFYDSLYEVFAESARVSILNHKKQIINGTVQVKNEAHDLYFDDEYNQSEDTFELTERLPTKSKTSAEQLLLMQAEQLASKRAKLELERDEYNQSDDIYELAEQLPTKSKTSEEHMFLIQAEQLTLERAKLDLEREKFQTEAEHQKRHLNLEERKFEAEKKWKDNHFRLKKMEMENDKEFRILKLQSKERMSMYEIERKYK